MKLLRSITKECSEDQVPGAGCFVPDPEIQDPEPFEINKNVINL